MILPEITKEIIDRCFNKPLPFVTGETEDLQEYFKRVHRTFHTVENQENINFWFETNKTQPHSVIAAILAIAYCVGYYDGKQV